MSFKEAKTYKYAIKFSIIYQAKENERIAVIGSIKELGEWKDSICILDLLEDNYWMNLNPVLTDSPVFHYKYILC